MTTSAHEPVRIQAVLDRSAMESYARGHIHVGELLIDIADEGAHVGVPATALLDAHSRALHDEHARALLRVLTTLEGIEILDLDADVAAAMAGSVPLAKGDMARAHAAWAANKHRAYYLTTEPDEAAGLVPVDNIHAMPVHDA
ncbi:hypothetical protein [Jidongwangia harbinensis]|uniref:hypothetical protein n=1 Tax=Jidongwangia harbinensis TaxID=2878561 RepID=UPI001CDA2578|nr:hypothetical protein [Jidongwangia harbinensis]MCA2215130.1 hypothetical protein [Jidongwangia harbinensis]